MLQISQLREQKDWYINALSKRYIKDIEQSIDKAIHLDETRRATQLSLDQKLAESNIIAKSIGQLMQQGKMEEAEKAKLESGKLKSQSKELSEALKKAEEELQQLLSSLPNAPHQSVKAGKGEQDNETLYEKGKKPILQEKEAHWDLIKTYDIIDFELGNKITGAGFPVYKGKGARLQRAMINYFLDQALDAGYFEIQPPIVVNEDSGYGTGQLPDKDGQMYQLVESQLYLIPTAEVPITNLYRDTILESKDLPVKLVGYTPCFRREAGSWGSHVRGLNRLHQFDKVEIVQISQAEQSYAVLEEMSHHVEGLIESLELPFRKLRLCGGDLGFTAALTYDFEVFSAAQEKWLEVSSVSNFETYQANRLKLRYRGEDKKTQLLHTLNGSALALPRILAAILENNQGKDGIRIPKVLVPYTGFEIIEKP